MPQINLDTKTGIDENGAEIQAIADDLQGNILKSHGRGHTSHIFFKFNKGKVAEAKAFLKNFANTEVISAKQQKIDIDKFKQDGEQRFFVNLFLSGSCYKYLGIPTTKTPKDQLFRNGMKASNHALADSPIDTWDEGLQSEEVHGMILIARSGNNRNKLDSKTQTIANQLTKNGLATVLQIDNGDGIKNANGDDIEHFGYVDGISQPNFFKPQAQTQNDQWDSTMPLDLVLVPDPGGKTENSFGSYFVYRKLEQNVKGFKESEAKLAHELFNKDTELAGAMVVGRFENGMPVTLSDSDEEISGVAVDPDLVGKINNFNYSADADAAKCPYHAHIRKTNPRGESPFEDTPAEKHHMMARRGIIYGKRRIHPNEVEISEMPTGDVGLLFMSFQADIGKQFEFIQRAWANEVDFVKGFGSNEPPTGRDPVIGQGDFPNDVHRYPRIYGDKDSIHSASGFGGFVTLKGGEYFFAPCLSALKNF